VGKAIERLATLEEKSLVERDNPHWKDLAADWFQIAIE
jgi:hypothetical protein